MNVLHRSALVVVASLLATAAGAQTPVEVRAEAAMAQLSARYQQIWPTLAPQQKQAFSAEERRWLNGARWDELKACVARTAAVPVSDRAATCEAQILEQRLQHLGDGTRLVRS